MKKILNIGENMHDKSEWKSWCKTIYYDFNYIKNYIYIYIAIKKYGKQATKC